METKHTPGPWKLGDGRTIETAGGEFYLAYGTEKGTGAPRWHGGFCALDANARLVAAAPELLDALRYMVENAEAAGWSGLMLDDGRAAIAKAEGRA